VVQTDYRDCGWSRGSCAGEMETVAGTVTAYCAGGGRPGWGDERRFIALLKVMVAGRSR